MAPLGSRHRLRQIAPLHAGVRLENGIYGHSRFCNTDFDDKLACLNLSGV
ncbi:integrase (plasmid) [Escherichia coli]|uniref:Integrase n=1 Tax=Escherichia coli TaxID=562 RepID=A0A7U5TQ55_ECOLX|nr:integrase [Escherichia coli]